MNSLSRNISPLIYFALSIFYMEVILRIHIQSTIVSLHMLIFFVFSITFAIIFFLLSSLFKQKVNTIVSFIFLSFTAFIFSSQLVYNNFFRTYYTFYSAGNAGQIRVFWRDILSITFENFFWIILFFLPVILLIFLRQKVVFFENITNQYRYILAGFLIIFHLVGVGTVYASGKDQHSAYDLYFESRNTILSIEKLGLITSMRLDFQRHLFQWSPTINNPITYEPLPTNNDEPEPSEDSNLSDSNNTNESMEQEPTIYNVMDIDFDALIEKEEDDEIVELHNYIQSVSPTNQNEYTGKYKGYNFIFITAESFAPYAVHKDITPTLYKMVHEGYNFTNFYTPLWDVSTTDGEYVALTGLLPKSGVWSFQESGSNHLPFVMGNQLKELGYKTVAYHNHSYDYYRRDITHPNMGYDYKGIGNGLEVTRVWPASDLEMFEVSIPEYIGDEPFHAYYMTVSGHLQYNFVGNNMAMKNRHLVEDLPFSQQAQAFLATQIELDKAMEHLLEQLELAGVAENTLIAMSTDHYPYGLDDEVIDELAGYHVEPHFELYRAPFILYTKNMEPVTIDRLSSSLDIIPTLSNLLGLEYDSRLLMGTDIFSDADPLVMFLDRSFITEKGKYNAVEREFIPNEGVEIDEDYIEWMGNVINSKFYYSAKMLDVDYYDLVFHTD